MGGKRNAGKMFKSSKNSKKKLTASGENNAQKLFHELVAEEDPTVISMEGTHLFLVSVVCLSFLHL
jgi:hypothetical protein